MLPANRIEATETAFCLDLGVQIDKGNALVERFLALADPDDLRIGTS